MCWNLNDDCLLLKQKHTICEIIIILINITVAAATHKNAIVPWLWRPVTWTGSVEIKLFAKLKQNGWPSNQNCYRVVQALHRTGYWVYSFCSPRCNPAWDAGVVSILADLSIFRDLTTFSQNCLLLHLFHENTIDQTHTLTTSRQTAEPFFFWNPVREKRSGTSDTKSIRPTICADIVCMCNERLLGKFTVTTSFIHGQLIQWYKYHPVCSVHCLPPRMCPVGMK